MGPSQLSLVTVRQRGVDWLASFCPSPRMGALRGYTFRLWSGCGGVIKKLIIGLATVLL
jgi:hypothetical protein